MPYLSEVFTYDYNMLHMCGNVEKHLVDNETEFKKIKGLNILSISHDVNLRRMQELFKGYFGIAGNVDHINLLPFGKPREVEQKCREIIEAGKKQEGYMLAPGCEITIDVPPVASAR